MTAILKNLIGLCLILGALSSCTKENNECDPNDEESPCYFGPVGGAPGDKLLLTAIITNGKTTETCEYNAQNLLTAIRFSDGRNGFELSYDNLGRISRLEHVIDRDSPLIEEYSYEGAADKPVRCETFTAATRDNPIITLYSYSQNKTFETMFDAEGNPLDPSVFTFDEKGNILIADIFVGNNQRSITTYADYDDKNAPRSKSPWWWKSSSVNNPGSIKISAAGQVTDVVHKYTYNDAGYPTKIEVYNRNSEVLKETIEYKYKKAN